MYWQQLPGYGELKSQLLQMGAGARIPHALLFSGAEGTPVVPLALGLIQFVFCQNKQPDGPCGACAPCHKTLQLVHPDVHLLFPLSGSDSEGAADETTQEKLLPSFRNHLLKYPYGTATAWGAEYGAGNRQPLISVREVRKLIADLALMSYEGGYKVAFVWLPELMNIPAANALLKILEEPPDKTLFILATYGQEALLPTVLSRVLQVRVRPAEDAELSKLLRQKGLAEADIAGVVLGAEGSFARALDLANQQDANQQDRFIGWMRACYGLQYADLVEQAEEFAKLGREGQKWRISYALSVFRHVLRYKVISSSEPAQGQEPLSKFYQALPLGALEPVTLQLEKLYDGISRNAAPKLAYLSSSLKMGFAMRQPS